MNLTIKLGATFNQVIAPGKDGPVVFDRLKMTRAERDKLRHLVVEAFRQANKETKD